MTGERDRIIRDAHPDQAIGIDTVSVERVAQLLAAQPRFANRVFSREEQEYCKGHPERFAARWAAKEAVRKVFGARQYAVLPPFHAITVERTSGGAPYIAINGNRQPFALSLSHSEDAAVAVVVDVAYSGEHAWWSGMELPAAFSLPPRLREAHKGTFGLTLVVGGSWEFQGAPMLAALAAGRAGSGLVRLCVPDSIVGRIASWALEIMIAPLPDAHRGVLTQEGIGLVLSRYLDRANALVIGMGAGQEQEASEGIRQLLSADLHIPLVIDADALQVLAHGKVHEQLHDRGCPVIITPHPGEMARMLNCTVSEVQGDREATAREAAAMFQCITVLKGANTVIAHPDGQLYISPYSVPALATGGSGDVLAGIIGSLLAQGEEPFHAAVSSVVIHAEAGLALARHRGEAGILARDIIESLPEVIEALRNAGARQDA